MRFYFHAGRPAWFLDPAVSGGGMFANVGLHRLTQTRAWVPGLAPCAASAAASRLAEYPVEACTSALVRYHGGGAMHYEERGYVARPSWWPLTTYYLFAEAMVTLDAARWRLVTRAGSEHEDPLQAPDNPYTSLYAICCAASTGSGARTSGLGVCRQCESGARRLRRRGRGARNRSHRPALAHRPRS